MSTGSEDVKATLRDMEVHDGWTTGYRTHENEPFYSLAFDFVASVFGAPEGEPILDAGCGSGTKSAHLAKRGYHVVGVDISERILEVGRTNMDKAGLSDRVKVQLADLLSMPFDDGMFRGVLCWGVLMHVPEVEKAIAELSRVTKPGGIIVVSEGNRYSIQAMGLRWLKRLLKRERAEVRERPSGIELWEETSTGRLVTRQADIEWLINEFERHGAQLIERRAGQFTEVFTLLHWKPLRSAIHLFNNLWFRWPRFAGPAFGNLLVFRKSG